MGEGSQGSLVLQARTVQGQDFVPNLVEDGDQFDHYPACGYYCDFRMKDLCPLAFMPRLFVGFKLDHIRASRLCCNVPASGSGGRSS